LHIRQKIAQQAQAFRLKVGAQYRIAGGISARSPEAIDQSHLCRVAPYAKDDWNRGGCLFCGNGRNVPTHRRDHRDRALHEISGQCRQPVVLAGRPPVFDSDVFSFHKPGLAQALMKGSEQMPRVARGAATHETNDGDCGLLCCG